MDPQQLAQAFQAFLSHMESQPQPMSTSTPSPLAQPGAPVPPPPPQSAAYLPASQNGPAVPLQATSSITTPPSPFPFPPAPSLTMQPPPENYAYPPPPSTCRPYSSLQMLASIGGGNGGVAAVGSSGHPRVTTAPGFPGMTTLIQRSNQSRLDHAGSSLPKKEKTPKRRGKAILPASLAGEGTKPCMGNCIIEAEGGQHVMNLDVSVYPPFPSRTDQQDCDLPNHIVHFSRNADSFRAVLSALNLFHQFQNLPVTTLIVDVFRTIVERIQDQYNLSNASSNLPFHERLPIQLLSFTNRGRPNGAYGTARLRTAPLSERTNLVDLLNNSYDFAVPRWALTRDNHFHIFAVIRRYPLEASLNLSEVFLGQENLVRSHRCISQRVYGLFRHDVDSVDVSDLDEEAMEHSQDCVVLGEEEVDEGRVIAQLLTPGISPQNIQVAPSTPVTSIAATPPPVTPTPPSSPTAGANALIQASAFPAMEKLWETPWMLPSPLDVVPMFFNSERTFQIFETVQARYIHINGVGCPGIDIEGTSDRELVQKMEGLMKDAIGRRDWSQILSPTRHFARTRVTPQGNSAYVSGGPGVEQEVMNALFKSYFDREDEFCTVLMDDYTTLTAFPNTRTCDLSLLKREQLVMFGAVTALALIYGSYPGRFNPLLLIYFLNNCNLGCLHRDLVASYFPSLLQTLDAWLALDHNDNVSGTRFLSHFSTFHNLGELGVLNGRSEDRHRTLAFEMIHNAIVGPVGVKNAYFQLFLEGFRLPCSGSLDFYDIVQSFHGGAEEFIQTAEISIISNYGDLNIEKCCCANGCGYPQINVSQTMVASWPIE